MNTRPTIRIGTDDFAKLLLESNVFVDKSLLIQEFIEDSGDVVLITRPRRWGKSLNMDMLGRFLAIEVNEKGEPLPKEQCLNHKLFAGGEVTLDTGDKKELPPLKIAQHHQLIEKYQGQYPVISLGFKDVKGKSYEEIEAGIKQALLAVFKMHIYLLQADCVTAYERDAFNKYLYQTVSLAEIKKGLLLLSELLYRHFGKPVYVLIDEYDTPINSTYLTLKNNPEDFEQVLQLFRGLLGATFKTNKYLKKGLITGILRIAKANLFSDLNNVREYTLLDKPFASSYGFTPVEVDELLKKVPTATPPAQIQAWYNGYTFGGEVIYNPWSMMCCLASEGQLDQYWIDSGGTALIDSVLLSDKIQQDLQTLVAGGHLERIIDRQIVFDHLDQPDKLYSLLLFSGYLNPTAVDTARAIYRLSVPNQEVCTIYEKRILEWVDAKLNIQSEGYLRLARLLADGTVKGFEETLQVFLAQATSFHQTGKKQSEVFYSGFMLCLLSMLSTYYMIESERESGLGRPDAMLIPKPTHGSKALLIEYKVSQEKEQLVVTAQAGLEQILAKDYSQSLQRHGHVKEFLAVCLAFCGKEVASVHKQVKL